MEISKTLVQYSLKNGSKDNISVLTLKFWSSNMFDTISQSFLFQSNFNEKSWILRHFEIYDLKS